MEHTVLDKQVMLSELDRRGFTLDWSSGKFSTFSSGYFMENPSKFRSILYSKEDKLFYYRKLGQTLYSFSTLEELDAIIKADNEEQFGNKSQRSLDQVT